MLGVDERSLQEFRVDSKEADKVSFLGMDSIGPSKSVERGMMMSSIGIT